ncbi:MAG: glycosyltransferase family 9 protein [Candidatus Cloacimonetes bacterium]|nr:glycosyltransferase family 9 protein [Candidatus Cloacimonadota bacterium]
MRVLVINLTRMGDLIQTIGLINAIHQQSPNARIDLLVMKSFAPIVGHFDHINEVISFDEEVFGANIPNDVWTAYAEMSKMIAYLNQNDYHSIYNPIISQQSSIITYLVKAEHKFGMQITATKEQKMTCDFSSYLLANQHSLGDFSFNLVDIFAGMTGRQTDPSGYNLKVFPADKESIKTISEKVRAAGKPVIGFHIGASASNKAWNIEYYRKVIDILLVAEKYSLILFGGYKEKDFEYAFTDIRHSLFFNLIGAFKLNELIAAIDIIDLMVTNDTGPMHIATALKKPVIDISLGPVSKWESGPYNQNALIIEANLDCHPCNFSFECPHWNCHHCITPDIVVNAVEYMFSGTLKPHPDVRFFTTAIDQFSFLSFTPRFAETISRKEYIFLLKRFVWSLYFRGQMEADKATLRQRFGEVLQPYRVPDLDFTDWRRYLLALIEIIDIIQKNLKNVTFSTDKIILDKNREYLLLVKKSKEALFTKAREYDLIFDWFWFFTFKESEIEVFELEGIIKQTLDLYEVLKGKLEIFNELL